MSAPSTPRGRKRSRASPPRTYFTLMYLFESSIYSFFMFLVYLFAVSSLNMKICRSVLHTRLFGRSTIDKSQTFLQTDIARIILGIVLCYFNERQLGSTSCVLVTREMKEAYFLIHNNMQIRMHCTFNICTFEIDRLHLLRCCSGLILREIP